MTNRFFLRAPPFPGYRPRAPAIVPPLYPPDVAVLDPRARQYAADLRAALVAGQVGGSFWAPPLAPRASGHWMMRPASVRAAQAMLAQAGNRAASKGFALVEPGTPRSVVRWLQRRGIAVWAGEVDPWSAVHGCEAIFASPGDDLAIAGHLAEVPVSLCDALTGEPAPSACDDIDVLVHQLLIDGVDYRDWFTGSPSTALAAVEQLAAWRVMIDQNRPVAALAGIAGWKRREIHSFLWADRPRPLTVARTPGAAIAACVAVGGALAVWPSRVPATLFGAAAANGVPVCQIEDGFIRSVGLGSGLHPPQSIVVDPLGIYYDPTRPSALETILQTATFSPGLLARAEALIANIVAGGISKYAAGPVAPLALPAGRRLVLVTGQVEDDRSVMLGGGGVTGNLDLLRSARAAEPDAYLIFKPHPDVEAGHRVGAVDEQAALQFVDTIARNVSIASLLDVVDEVHVWTSLAGFEALLRHRAVTVHGQPFYAGWGLTRDLAPPIARRTRQVTLTELVSATLILYPRYLDPITKLPCTPELLISRMAAPGAKRTTMLTSFRLLHGRINRWMR